jgi:23S rRNA pseudouridine1911/1915/1917 synthase
MTVDGASAHGDARDLALTLKVGDADAGLRLDRFLSGPVGSRAQAQRLIEDGRVRVDGAQRSKSYAVSVGEVVSVSSATGAAAGAAVGAHAGVPDAEATPTGTALPWAPYVVAYEDEHLLIVDKPAGVVVHPARGHRTGTLAQALAGRAAGGEDEWRAGIVHRLDRDTSGLLVVAKSDAVHRALKALLAARELRREYLALVEGRPESTAGTIDAPIGRHPRDRIRMSIDGAEPREARTHFEIERVLASATLLRVRLETGRTHQIRVHLAAIGLPVCGDRQYGTPDAYGLERQFLHAARLAFMHPMTGRPVDVSSPLPADLTAALAAAESARGR